MKKKEVIARRILSYLQKNPDAESSLEVIAAEWVRTECIEEAVDEVAEVLDGLINEGMITSFSINGSNPVYKISDTTRYDWSKLH